jgi:hypothetical protein
MDDWRQKYDPDCAGFPMSTEPDYTVETKDEVIDKVLNEVFKFNDN